MTESKLCFLARVRVLIREALFYGFRKLTPRYCYIGYNGYMEMGTALRENMKNYIGLIHKDPDSDYGVHFPDFPGVITAGVDLDEARAMAKEALAFHVEGMIEDGDAIPEPSSLEALMADPENQEAVAVVVSLSLSKLSSAREK